MRLVINVSQLTLGGGLVVGTNLLRSIRQVRKTYDLFAFIPPHLGYERICAEAQIEFAVLRPMPPQRLWRLVMDNVVIPSIATEWRADAIFNLGNSGPIVSRVPHAMLLQNALLVFGSRGIPGWGLTDHIALALQASLARLAMRSAVVVFPQTTAVAERLKEVACIPDERIKVVPNAINPTTAPAPTDGGLAAKLASLREGRTVFLHFAYYYPHKNFEYLIDVVRELPAAVRERIVFVVTIEKHQHPNAARFLKRVSSEGLGSVIVNLGAISGGQVATLFNAVDALFFPSLIESFSTTYLEAMAHGTPILTSDRPFARECCGDAALYFNPLQATSGAAVVTRFEASEDLRLDLKARATQQLLRQGAGNWDDVADAYMKGIENALARTKLGL